MHLSGKLVLFAGRVKRSLRGRKKKQLPPTPFGKLFDPLFYSVQTGVRTRHCYQHFVHGGWRDNRNPHPLFDVSFYLSQFPALDDGIDPLWHYMVDGWRQGLSPHPLFEVEFYRRQLSPDVKLDKSDLEHYLEIGWSENLSPHPMFCAPFYAHRNPDIAKANMEPMVHFVLHGIGEGRSPSGLYHPVFLRQQIQDLASPDGEIVQLFMSWDREESPTPLLDVEYYCQHHPEAVRSGLNPFQHFVQIGMHKNYDPNPYFSNQFYLDQYGDQLDGLSPLAHYLTHEGTLQFNPSELFDVQFYWEQNPDLHGMRGRMLEHFLEYGQWENRQVKPTIIPEFLTQQLRQACELDPTIRIRPEQLESASVNRANATDCGRGVSQDSRHTDSTVSAPGVHALLEAGRRGLVRRQSGQVPQDPVRRRRRIAGVDRFARSDVGGLAAGGNTTTGPQ